MGTEDIDALWAEMQATTDAPKRKTKSKKKSVQAAVQQSTPETAVVVADAVDSRSMQRNINTICDAESDRRERTRAMECICAQMKAVKASGDQELGQSTWDQCLKPLVKRVYDDVEKIRIMALETLIEGFELTDALMDSTPYVIPVILDRMVRAEAFQFEPSEEVRLRHIRLVQHLLMYKANAIMQEHAQEILTIVVAATRDTAPEVKKVALSCVRPITKTVAHYSIWKQETAMLMDAVGFSLKHRHASVRMAGLEAIDALMRLGGAAEPLQAVAGDQIRPQTWGDVFTEEVKNNFLAMMIQDGNAAVRAHFYRLLGEWLSELEDKMDHEHLLAPYLLSGLGDNSMAIREATVQAIEKVGIRYEADNQLDFREEIEYGLLKHEDSRFRRQGAQLPEPLKGRPRIGSRVFVRSHAYRMIPAVIRELKEPLFTETVRLRSATLLRFILGYLEEHATKFTRQFFDAFMMAMNLTKDDKDPVLITTMLGCAELLGSFVDVNIYLPFIQLDTVLGISNPAGSLMLATAILRGMPEAEMEENAVMFHEMFVPVDICESDDYDVQHAVLELVECILERREGLSTEELLSLAYTMLHMDIGHSHQGEEAQLLVQKVKSELQARFECVEVYQDGLLGLVLDRFDDATLSPLFGRSCALLSRAIEDIDSARLSEQFVERAVQVVQPVMKGDGRGEQMQRCLDVVDVLLHKSAHVSIAQALGSLTRFRSMSDDTMAVLMRITARVLTDVAVSRDFIAATGVVFGAVLREADKRGAELGEEATACMKGVPEAKQAFDDSEYDPEEEIEEPCERCSMQSSIREEPDVEEVDEDDSPDACEELAAEEPVVLEEPSGCEDEAPEPAVDDDDEDGADVLDDDEAFLNQLD